MDDISKMLLDIRNEKRRVKKELDIQVKPIDIEYDFKCTDCNCIRIKEIEGYYVCLECGLKIETIIDSGQEWRNYNNDDSRGGDNARCDYHTNELLPKTNMGSIVGFGGCQTFTSKRIRNINHWYSITYKDCSLIESFNNITVMAINSGINQCVIEEAKVMYKKVSDIKSSRRTKKEGMKAGAISLACKLKGVPRNTIEIAKICHMKNNKTLRKSIKTFEEIWNTILEKEHSDIPIPLNIPIVNINISITNTTYPTIQPIIQPTIQPTISSYSNPITLSNSIVKENQNKQTSHEPVPVPVLDKKKYIQVDETEMNHTMYNGKLHRFINDLSLDEKIYNASRIVLEYTEKNNYLDKHNPLSRITAIIFYIVDRYKLKISKYQIIKTCSVSDVTINKCYQKLMKYKNELNSIDIDL
jgi:transcription initiation factor TFIIIB Brf1 subunit/transcription initiation factor TFIIB